MKKRTAATASSSGSAVTAPLAGLAKVPFIIKKGLNELKIRRLQVTENNDRDDLTAYEEAMGVI